MGYKIKIVFADGYCETIECATAVEVESHVVEIVRRAIGIKSQIVNITVIQPWIGKG